MRSNKIWNLLLEFFWDYLPVTVCYFAGFGLVNVFYMIATGNQVEFVYPFLLALFVYLVGAVYYFARYYKFYRAVEEMLSYDDLSIQLNGKIESHVMEQMWKMHHSYMNQLDTKHLEQEKERRFLSMLIHNMKTPVTVNDLLIQRMQNQEVDRQVGIVQMKEENDRLLKNLDQTLNMLRLEEFQKDYVPEPLELVAELRNIINQNKKQFIYSKVYPKIETSLNEAWILSDQKWNELMILQLISNGIKYSRAETEAKHLYFELKREEEHIMLTIRDEGIGIPDYDLGKVFEPFFTGENGRKGYSSSGIGLYFCKEVANCLGHELSIESKEGKGTCVTIAYLAKL